MVNWTGLSVNAFARCIGLKRAENLYQIKRGNNGISRELAELITTKYSTINKSWLLTGTGEMFLDDSHSRPAAIPFYKVEVVRLISAREHFTPSGYFTIPNLADSDLAALLTSHAMEPELPYGAYLFLKQSTLETVIPGKAYLVMSTNFCGVRIVRREAGSPHIRLLPCNAQNYDEVVVETTDVESVYAIKGYLAIR